MAAFSCSEMNLYQPCGGPTNRINPWLNMAPVSQNVPNGNGNADFGPPLGLPPPPTPNMNDVLPAIPMREPLLYFSDKHELKPPSAYEQPLQVHDHQQEAPDLHNEQNFEFNQYNDQFGDQPQHEQPFSGQLDRHWQFQKPKYDKRNKDWKKKKAWRESKQSAASRNKDNGCETENQTDPNNSWTTLKAFSDDPNKPIGLNKRLSNTELEFINGGISKTGIDCSDEMENNVDEMENDASSDELDENNFVGSEIGVDDITDEDTEEKLPDNDGQMACVTSEMKTQPNILRITLQNGKRTSMIKTEKHETFFCSTCNVCCTSKQGLDSHNATESHVSKMEALEAANGIKTNRLLARMESDSDQPLETRYIKGKFCKVCNTRVIGSNFEHKKSLEHKKNKITNQPNCQVCDQRFRSPAQFLAHLKTHSHIHNGLQKSKLVKVKSSPESAAHPREVPVVPVDDTARSHNAIQAKDVTQAKLVNVIEEDGDTSKWTGNEVGKWLLVPLTGLYCKGCKKYYEDRDRAAKHCRSLAHFKKYKEYRDKGQQSEKLLI